MLESKVAFAPRCTASGSTLVVLCATNRSRGARDDRGALVDVQFDEASFLLRRYGGSLLYVSLQKPPGFLVGLGAGMFVSVSGLPSVAARVQLSMMRASSARLSCANVAFGSSALQAALGASVLASASR
jgi:hypothetical protein